MITQTQFVVRLLLAFVLGAGIGIERQWQKSRAVMRINVLASLGAAIFVMTTVFITQEEITVRTTSQIILGISLISASIILQRKVDYPTVITGITVWCAGGIGSLVGSGFFFPAYVSTIAIVLANLIFQPREYISANKEFEEKKNKKLKSKNPQKLINSPIQKILYRCQVICFIEDEPEILALLVQAVREKKLMLIAVCSKNLNNQDRSFNDKIEIQADFLAETYKDKLELEKAVGVVKSKIKTNSVSWEYIYE